METIAVCNQKGGVGKTTVTLLLADSLTAHGARVLVCDLDPQSNATAAADVAVVDGLTLADALLEPRRAGLLDVVRPSSWGFDVAPAETGLALKERNRRTGDEHHLRELLAAAPLWDVVLIDCPPSLGVLTVSALTAADRYLVVADASYFALQGIAHLLETTEVVHRYFNAHLTLAGVVVNLVDHTLETRRRIEEIERYFGGDAIRPHLPRRVVVKEAIAAARRLRSYRSEKGADEIVELVDAIAMQLVASHVA